MKTPYFVYSFYDCIDWGWEFLFPISENQIPGVILRAAKEAGWDGDFRSKDDMGWYPSIVSNEGDHMSLLPCFLWKQDNNGGTFVASPVLFDTGADLVAKVEVLLEEGIDRILPHNLFSRSQAHSFACSNA